jgi:hypothetical protein
MKTWTVRRDAESEEWQRRLGKLHPLATRHRVLQLAMRYGLRTFATHPQLLLEEAAGADSETAVQP